MHRGRNLVSWHISTVGWLRRRKRASIGARARRRDLRAYAKQLSSRKAKFSASPSAGARERGICARRHAERELICEKLRGIKWFLIKFQPRAVPMGLMRAE
jgi:hypothetical protein